MNQPKTYYFPFSKFLALFQSVYFLITGIWPILHIDSFMMASGLKTDIWLVKTVGVLITAIAVAIFFAYKKQEITYSIILLAILSAAGLLAIDLYYVFNDVIWDIYLADAALEAVFIGAWIYVIVRK